MPPRPKTSAGLLLYRRAPGGIEIFLAHPGGPFWRRRDEGAWTIPKGAVYTEADVRFMQGMIAHHAQAIYMSRLAAAHQASPRLTKFAQKIDQSQIAEIRIMQQWLRSNDQFAPDTASWRHLTMPGMLTDAN